MIQRESSLMGRRCESLFLEKTCINRGLCYIIAMTKLLEQAVDAARTLPPAMQDDVARLLLQFLGKEQPAIQLTPEEVASFAESRAQASRREFATDDHVRAVWAKHGL
jgi:hypothetical protein